MEGHHQSGNGRSDAKDIIVTYANTNKNIERPDWLPQEVWPHEIRTVDLDGSTVAYTDAGEGPSLLLIHDGMWSYIWAQLIEQLVPQHRVITLDFPGSGLSPTDGREPGLESDSVLLERFVDQLGLDHLTLIAHDLGGSVALGLATRRPELVNGIVAINTFAWPPHVRSLRTMLRTISCAPVSAINVATGFVFRLTKTGFGIGRHLEKVARQAFLGPYHSRKRRKRFHQLMGAALAEQDYLSSVERGLRTVLAGKPILTVYGEKNDPFGFQARFREYFSDVSEMVIPGGNHFPMCDDPGGVAERITDWGGWRA